MSMKLEGKIALIACGSCRHWRRHGKAIRRGGCLRLHHWPPAARASSFVTGVELFVDGGSAQV